MRETLQQAARKLLTAPPGSEHSIAIFTNDGLTGLPPGPPQRGSRIHHTVLQVAEETRADGRKRQVVVSKDKRTVVASTAWA